MIVAVTGGTGFVGANIVRHLAMEGHKVLCVSRSGGAHDPAVKRFFAPFADDVVHVPADVGNFNAVVDLCARYEPDQIVHGAAITPTRELEMSNPLSVVHTNIIGTMNVLEAARQSLSVRRVTYLSSGAVYGETDERMVLAEESSAGARDLYGLTKETGEKLCAYYRERHGKETLVIRVGWVYGPMERPMGASRQGMSLVYFAAALAVRGEEIRLVHLNHIRDWIYSGDVSAAIALLLVQDPQRHHIYNLSAGRGYTHNELLDALGKVTSVRYRQTTEREANVPPSLTQRRRGPMSIARLQADIGFRPRVGLEDGLHQYVEWVRDEEYRSKVFPS